MKRVLIILILLIACPAFAANPFDGKYIRYFTSHIGGTDADLDSWDGAELTGNEVAYVFSDGAVDSYLLDVDSAATEALPYIIAPDSNAGDKRWIRYGSTGGDKQNLCINHTAWPNGLSGEEIFPIHVAAGQTFNLYRLDIDIKGGGSDADLAISVYNETADESVSSETADDTANVGDPIATVAGAAELSVRVTNATGDTSDAAITVIWSVE